MGHSTSRTKAYVATPVMWPNAARGIGADQHVVQVAVYLLASSKAAAREHLESLGVSPTQAHAVVTRARLTTPAHPVVAALGGADVLDGVPRAFVGPTVASGGRSVRRLDPGLVFASDVAL